MASRVGAVSTADVGRLVAEQRRKREGEEAERARVAPAPSPMPRAAFGLHYTISNNGDGSASLRLHRSAARAQAADEAEPEPFTEPTAGCLRFRVHADGATIEVDEGRGTWVRLSPVTGEG